jgi:hypothetical protein
MWVSDPSEARVQLILEKFNVGPVSIFKKEIDPLVRERLRREIKPDAPSGGVWGHTGADPRKADAAHPIYPRRIVYKQQTNTHPDNTESPPILTNKLYQKNVVPKGNICCHHVS